MADHETITIEELEAALRGLCVRYLSSLSTQPVNEPERVRLECTGDGVSVMYETHSPEGMPSLVVSLVPAWKKL